MSIRIVSAAEVRQLLPVPACIDLMADAMTAASNGSIAIPPRLVASLIDRSGFFALMPGSSLNPRVYGAKVASLHPTNPAKGRPAVQGFVAVFDHATGAPVGIVEGGAITALRTAATSGLATRLLARPDASSHGVFGTGVQAVEHIEAIAAVRPIRRVLVWGRSPEKARKLAAEQTARTGLKAVAVEDPARVAGCDVVSTVTGATQPILQGTWLAPGSHVNLVGTHSPTAREADSEAVARARVYVDLMQSALTEAGDLLIPMQEGRIDRSHIIGELGALVAGAIPGRRGPDEITLYKSLGVVAQDLFAAAHVMQRARTLGVGTQVEL